MGDQYVFFQSSARQYCHCLPWGCAMVGGSKGGGLMHGTAKAEKSSSWQQLGAHAPTPQALLGERQLAVGTYSLYQITGNVIFKSIWNELLSDRSSVSVFES